MLDEMNVLICSNTYSKYSSVGCNSLSTQPLLFHETKMNRILRNLFIIANAFRSHKRADQLQERLAISEADNQMLHEVIHENSWYVREYEDDVTRTLLEYNERMSKSEKTLKEYKEMVRQFECQSLK